MIALNVAKLKFFTPEIEISLRIKHKKNVFGESGLDQFRSLEIREKVLKKCFCDKPASV